MRFESNYIDAPLRTAALTNDSPGTVTFGACYRPAAVVLESGRTALPCCAVPWVAVFAGYGTLKIMSGLRYTRSTNNDGSTLMPARKLGITHACTLRAGARRCHTASPSLLTVPPMSHDDMYERANALVNATDAPKRSCFISCKK